MTAKIAQALPGGDIPDGGGSEKERRGENAGKQRGDHGQECILSPLPGGNFGQ
ncbi:MAG: hypothetical protein IPL58_14375 [Betaproteobacteria bacterium]|uniref:Uncharacterized protein n=1 Tax=Candidatus Proximibacter danicus TaxID=2954365 RepID=A0A9D7K441_9PROT|nr:hypothetical protein [Candidatus Proximibacter danicus]